MSIFQQTEKVIVDGQTSAQPYVNQIDNNHINKQQNQYRQNNILINGINNQKNDIDRQHTLELFKQLMSVVNKTFQDVVSENRQLKQSKAIKITQKLNKIPQFKKSKSVKISKKQKELQNSNDQSNRLQSDAPIHKKSITHQPIESPRPDLTQRLKQQIFQNYSLIMNYKILSDDQHEHQQIKNLS